MAQQSKFGWMLTPMMGNKPDLTSTWWGADTGCFSNPDSFSIVAYLNWLDARPRETCLFATAPDVVGDANATWRKSASVLPMIRSLGYKAALVAQDGIENPDWDTFDVLFVGGTTTFKLAESTYALAQEAKERGKWCHMGRVNSERRLRAAAISGYDSVDGTYLKFGRDVLLPRLREWMRRLDLQPVLQ